MASIHMTHNCSQMLNVKPPILFSLPPLIGLTVPQKRAQISKFSVNMLALLATHPTVPPNFLELVTPLVLQIIAWSRMNSFPHAQMSGNLGTGR